MYTFGRILPMKLLQEIPVVFAGKKSLLPFSFGDGRGDKHFWLEFNDHLLQMKVKWKSKV
jgi:hypothetical protein